MAVRTTARTAAFMPWASPPEVRTPMRRGSPSRPSSGPADEPVGEGTVSEDMAAGMWGPSLGSPVGLAPDVGREGISPYCCW